MENRQLGVIEKAAHAASNAVFPRRNPFFRQIVTCYSLHVTSCLLSMLADGDSPYHRFTS